MSNNDYDIEDESQYETLIFSKSPLASRLELAINDIKDFIRKKGLIITGGTAIDFALRLKGDKIYSDETLVFPDLDFYSPNHTKDAYEIADMLYTKGYGLDKVSFEDIFITDTDGTGAEVKTADKKQQTEEDRLATILEKSGEVQAYQIYAHIARHITTIRVKLHSYEIADVTYIPINIFNKLPYIIYDGMKVIHPQWQYMNMHHALAFPLANPPFEVLFHRMSKDIERFSKLYSYYPIPCIISSGFNITKIPITEYSPDNVLYGFAAYAVIYNIYTKLVPHLLDGIPALSIDATHFTSPLPRADYIVIKPPSLPITFEKYNPYVDYTLPTYIEKTSELSTYIHVLGDSFIPIEYRTISGRRYSVPSVQHILMFMLFGYHTDPDYRDTYAAFYTGLLKMIDGINHLVERLSKDDAAKDKLQTVVLSTPFFIPTKLYGDKNVSESTELLLMRVSNDLRRIIGAQTIALPNTPYNYYPDKKAPHPEFDYTISKYFQIDGEKSLVIEEAKEDDLTSENIMK